MKTQSAKKLYRTYRDKQGVKRRQYHKACVDCGTDLWVAKHMLLKTQRCRACNYWFVAKNPERNAKISATLRAKYQNDADFKRKVAKAQTVKSGAEHWNWKGGITPLNQRTRTSGITHAWKLAVLYRDNYQCRICKNKNKLQAHHINGWAEFPEDRHILENGLTLCKKCHKQYHLYEKEVRKNVNFRTIS